jgi:hypothetical protein
VCGGRSLDLEALQGATRYEDGLGPSHPLAVWFWEVNGRRAAVTGVLTDGNCPGAVRRPLGGYSGFPRVRWPLRTQDLRIPSAPRPAPRLSTPLTSPSASACCSSSPAQTASRSRASRTWRRPSPSPATAATRRGCQPRTRASTTCCCLATGTGTRCARGCCWPLRMLRGSASCDGAGRRGTHRRWRRRRRTRGCHRATYERLMQDAGPRTQFLAGGGPDLSSSTAAAGLGAPHARQGFCLCSLHSVRGGSKLLSFSPPTRYRLRGRRPTQSLYLLCMYLCSSVGTSPQQA